jgi:lycopene beta-cyclase
MSYLAFHLVFILPPLVVLVRVLPAASARWGPRGVWTLPVVALIAFVYTTPWDNYLLYRGVWWYGLDRVLGTIGYVPVEEYLFFMLQPLLTGAWTYQVLLGGAGGGGAARRSAQPGTFRTRVTGAALYLAAGVAGAFALGTERGLYTGLILAWAAPVLAAQWAFVAPRIVADPRAFLIAVWAPTLYLWIADRIAIGLGIWSISPRYTTGLHILGLPVEEALFFLATNLLVVQGVLLFLEPVLDWFPPTKGAAALRAA